MLICSVLLGIMIFLSQMIDKVKTDAKKYLLTIITIILALFTIYSISSFVIDIFFNSPTPTFVEVTKEDGTTTKEKYFIDDEGNYYKRTDNQKITYLFAPFVEPEYEKVNLQIGDVNNKGFFEWME